jgi:hypothetical protein
MRPVGTSPSRPASGLSGGPRSPLFDLPLPPEGGGPVGPPSGRPACQYSDRDRGQQLGECRSRCVPGKPPPEPSDRHKCPGRHRSESALHLRPGGLPDPRPGHCVADCRDQGEPPEPRGGHEGGNHPGQHPADEQHGKGCGTRPQTLDTVYSGRLCPTLRSSRSGPHRSRHAAACPGPILRSVPRSAPSGAVRVKCPPKSGGVRGRWL